VWKELVSCGTHKYERGQEENRTKGRVDRLHVVVELEKFKKDCSGYIHYQTFQFGLFWSQMNYVSIERGVHDNHFYMHNMHWMLY